MPRVLPAGPFGVLLEFDSLEKVQRCFAWVEGWRASRPGVLVDVVPAERTLLAIATFDDAGRRGLREFAAAVRDVDWTEAGGAVAGAVFAEASETTETVETVELPVLYNGPDLDDIARLTGLATSEIVLLHTETEFTVAFTGFAPGFAYLTGLPDALRVPRRDAPRTRVQLERWHWADRTPVCIRANRRAAGNLSGNWRRGLRRSGTKRGTRRRYCGRGHGSGSLTRPCYAVRTASVPAAQRRPRPEPQNPACAWSAPDR